MKKIFALVLLIGVLAGCAAGQNEYLIGEWHWGPDGAYMYVFNEDGTGERGFSETRDEFTWTTRGNTLNIHRLARTNPEVNEVRDEVWTFEIYEYVLTLTNANRPPHNEEHRYYPATYETNSVLAGEWQRENDTAFVLNFGDDGNGTRGFPNERDNFTWTAGEYRLSIIRETRDDAVRGELWVFEVDEDRLTITSLQTDEDEERVYNFIKVQ